MTREERSRKLRASVPAVALRDDKPIQGLTLAQEKLAQGIANGERYVSAYMSAHGITDREPRDLYGTASEAASNPKVVSRVSQLLTERMQVATLAPLVTREFVLSGLASEAMNAPKASDRIKAFEALGRTNVVGLYDKTDSPPVDKRDRSIDDIERELRAKIGQLVDVTPRSEPEA